jgi:predicted dienelactone hydrolase
MIKTGIRAARSLVQGANRTTQIVARATGINQQVESFQRSVESIPLAKELKNFVKVAADQIAPEKLPLYKVEAGPHKVGTYKQTYVDETRGREIPLTVYYPESPKEDSPVVVFSHGLAANSVTHRFIGRHLASHGYTVLQPTHKGSDTKAVVTRTPLLAFSQQELVERTKDISFSLDLLQDGALPAPITEHADTQKVALAGHSFGALTSQAMAGLKARDEHGESLVLQDDRIDAFIAMSPYGDSAPTQLLGLDTETYDEIDQPILYLSGDQDKLFTLGKGHKVHSMPYQETGSEDKYNVVIGGARHVDFAQVFGWADRDTADMTKSTSVAFLDAHLQGDQVAAAYLADDLAKVARSRDSLAQGD